ncbi:inositol monophosphatase family protein [Frankia sp. QA3]|uniref:inositol monophosphatase family protein n=1 Tax=Frankia sp. QA3 TaxID=710111 RepID=UPI000269C2F8|nr:inositol monophosphatase family protein [Frankia sp. QA3]EIV91179.1 inositol monophosphatase/fructose-1,6-bisphosphatase family protein [Frankia sp. QA3]
MPHPGRPLMPRHIDEPAPQADPVRRPRVRPDRGVDLEAARDFAVATAQAAGDILRSADPAEMTVLPKGSRGDVVTDLDLAAETCIVERIRAAFPGHAIHSEEAGEIAGDDAWLWLTDPLDGTNNLAVGLSMYVVGITLCHTGVPVVGVIHDPVADQTWSAVRGRGMVGPRRPDGPGRGGRVLAWTQGYEVGGRDTTATALKLVLEQDSRRLLQLWTPLLSWAMLARGDIDGFVGYRAGALDLHAGALIAAEAGLVIVDFDGRPFDHTLAGRRQPRDFIAGPAGTVRRILALTDQLAHTRGVLDQLWPHRPRPAAPSAVRSGRRSTEELP